MNCVLCELQFDELSGVGGEHIWQLFDGKFGHVGLASGGESCLATRYLIPTEHLVKSWGFFTDSGTVYAIA